MSEIKTWDDMVETVAERSFHDDWKTAPKSIKELQRRRVAFLMRCIRAAGFAIMPRAATALMEHAHDQTHAAASNVFAEVSDLWRAMLTAGEIKPPKGE